MAKSATDVMQDLIVSAVLDSIAALKAASKGLPNNLLRDLNAVHANTTFADLPKELQDAIMAIVRSAFTRLQKEGYTVTDRTLAPPPPRNIPSRDRPSDPNRRPPPRGDGRDRKPGPGGNRPRPGGGGPRSGPKQGPRT